LDFQGNKTCRSNPDSISRQRGNPDLFKVIHCYRRYEKRWKGTIVPYKATIGRESGQREPPVDTLQHMELVWYSIASHFEGKG
jgi:hypothetical protein